MARLGRLAGAILAETMGEYYLIGDLKRPCDFSAAGFEQPKIAINGLDPSYLKLEQVGEVNLSTPQLQLELEGEALAEEIAHRFIIRRNGSISERLWDLILEPDELAAPPSGPTIDARWLGEIPREIFDIVRDQVLRCL